MRSLLIPFRKRRVHFPRPGVNFHTLAPVVLLALSLPFLLTGGIEGPIAGAYERLGLSSEGFINHHSYWQIASYSLLHGSWTHWLTNAAFIYFFGGRLHGILGEREVWRTAGGALLAGGAFHLLFQGEHPLVGASGFGLGLFAAVATISPESRMFPLPLRARNLRNGMILASLILLVLLPTSRLPLLSGLGQGLVDLGFGSVFLIGHACHLGGALAGIVAMRKYLGKPISLAQLRKERAAREEHDAA